MTMNVRTLLSHRSIVCAPFVFIAFLICVGNIHAQADEACREFGETPSREVGRDNRLVPFVFGRIVIRGLRQDVKPPRVTAMYSDSLQPAKRQLIGKTGNYCFQKRGTSGTIIIEIDGIEVARKTVSDLNNQRTREDFEVTLPQSQQTVPPGVVSVKFVRPPNDHTLELYKKTAEAEQNKEIDKAVETVKQIVAIDPEDFIAWAKLGSLYASANSLIDAEAALKHALSIRRDYTPAILNLGLLKAMQSFYPEAIGYFERAVASDPASARAYRLLGEAYLQVKRGSDGLAALDEALRIDPVGMAECHLLKARLYDLAGAKNLAVAEYKAFLTKVPDSPDKKKFEKYIKDNS